MYYCFMWLDRFRNKYWFNFLAIAELINSIIFYPMMLSIIFTKNNQELGFPFAILLFGKISFDIIICTIALYIYIFERVSGKEITNKIFLNSKLIICLQNTSILLFLVFIIFILFTYLPFWTVPKYYCKFFQICVSVFLRT